MGFVPQSVPQCATQTADFRRLRRTEQRPSEGSRKPHNHTVFRGICKENGPESGFARQLARQRLVRMRAWIYPSHLVLLLGHRPLDSRFLDELLASLWPSIAEAG